MKKLFVLLMLLLALGLTSCGGVDLKQGENQLSDGEYNVCIVTNTDYLTISLTDEDIAKYESYVKGGQIPSMDLIVNGQFYPAAHDRFERKEDVNDPTKWYTMLANDPNVSAGDPNSKQYLTNENIGEYRQQMDFVIRLKEDAPADTYQVYISDIQFPQCNIFSGIIVGSEGYQEINSVKGGMTNNGYIANIHKGEPLILTAIIYVDGNDEMVTNANASFISSHTGSIQFSINVEKMADSETEKANQ